MPTVTDAPPAPYGPRRHLSRSKLPPSCAVVDTRCDLGIRQDLDSSQPTGPEVAAVFKTGQHRVYWWLRALLAQVTALPSSSLHGCLSAVHVQFVTRCVTKPAMRAEAGQPHPLPGRRPKVPCPTNGPVTDSGDFGYASKVATWNSQSPAQYLAVNGPQRAHPTRCYRRHARTGQVHDSMEDAASPWRGLKPHDREDWVFQPRRGQRLGALTPFPAAPIRAAKGLALVSTSTGQVLVTTGSRKARPARHRAGSHRSSYRLAPLPAAAVDRQRPDRRGEVAA